MKKTAAIGALGTIILFLVTLLVIFGIGPKILKSGKSFFSLFGIGESEASDNKAMAKPISNAELAFSSFISLYESCKKYESNICLCDQFEVSTITQGYSIKLENLNGEKTRIELYGNKPTPEKASVIENDNLCLYNYDKSSDTFNNIQSNNIVLDSAYHPYIIANKIQLFKLDNKNMCFIGGTQESKNFDELTRSLFKCSLKGSTTKTLRLGMLDLSDYTGDYSPQSNVQSKDDTASIIIEELNTFLLSDIGRVTRITGKIGTSQGRLERRKNMFNDAYKNFDNNQNNLISDDVYFISIRALSLQAKNSNVKKDYFTVHYIQGSGQSKILADKVISRLQQLNGKLIYNDKEVGIAEVPEEYRLDFEIFEEENSKDNPGPVFLTCTLDYRNFIACKESALIPAIFIDVVEVAGDGHNLFQGHEKSIARKIYEGVKDYLTLNKI